MKKKILAILATLAAVVAMSFAFAAPASANVQCIGQGSDRACVSHGYTVNSGGEQEHRIIGIQDNECDGHTVRVAYRVQGSNDTHYLKDENGCAEGFYYANWVSTGKAITAMNLAEGNGNGGWNYSGWYHPYSHIQAVAPR